jgi:asparagine synthase (glutamine-hydrolysing)
VCGISGAVCLAERGPIDPMALLTMRETMVHRGPDSAGMVTFPTAGLAMRRLSIIDVASGQQPLASEDDQVQVVCNGEIYNHRELRAELERAGHRFRTFSDCEVIVHAYEEYGDTFLHHLNGMFGLALWDESRRRLVLARDRVGIKPLYYALHDGLLLFGSEAKALLAYPGFPRELDLVSLDQYLAYQYVPTPRSIYAGVSKLRPGHALIVEDGRVVERPYWRLDLSSDAHGRRPSDIEQAERLWQTLRESVRMELVSDVPLGVFLSGGIDSSAVVAAMTELNYDVRTFTVGFDEPSFDESRHARRVASYFGTQHSETILEPRMLWEMVPSVADVLDEPLADGSIMPTYLLSRFTREHVTVALGGDGGDELFAGYSTLQAHQFARYYRQIPRFLRERIAAPLVRRLPVSHQNLSFDFRAKRFIQGADLPPAVQHHIWLGPCGPDERRALLRPEVREQIGVSNAFDALDEHIADGAGYDELSRVLYLDMKMYLESGILTKVDRASMACSLEVRVPLLNTKMLDLVTHLPVDLKLRGMTRKYLLRKALASRLPREVIDRPKKGFGFPVSRWLRGELRELMLDLLSEDRLHRQGIFNVSGVSHLIAQHLHGARDNRMALWALVIFQLWHRHYLERPVPTRTPATALHQEGVMALAGAR